MAACTAVTAGAAAPYTLAAQGGHCREGGAHVAHAKHHGGAHVQHIPVPLEVPSAAARDDVPAHRHSVPHRSSTCTQASVRLLALLLPPQTARHTGLCKTRTFQHASAHLHVVALHGRREVATCKRVSAFESALADKTMAQSSVSAHAATRRCREAVV